MMSSEDYLECSHEELLKDADYRSGYEYAQKNILLWQGESPESLRFAAESCIDQYRQYRYRQVLGLAAFLRELADTKVRRGE